MKYIIVSALLYSTKAFSCGVFLDSYHQRLNELNQKQFPNLDIIYDEQNPNHRGWRQYWAKSLHGTRTLSLTYDDGPHPVNTPKLLDVLKTHKVKATFFVVAALAQKYPLIIKRIVDEGHILASHDYKHDNSNGETQNIWKKGLEDSILIVKKYDPRNESYYRFPYGAYASRKYGYHHLNSMKEVSQKLFGANCINFAFWDIDTSDWVKGMTPENIVETLNSNLDGGRAWKFKSFIENGRITYKKISYQIDGPLDGGVVLMHDIHETTVQATKLFLEQNRKIRFLLLNEIEEFSYRNLECKLLNHL